MEMSASSPFSEELRLANKSIGELERGCYSLMIEFNADEFCFVSSLISPSRILIFVLF